MRQIILCMGKILLFSIFSLLFTQYTIAQNQNMDSLSYSLGLMLASNLKSQGFDTIDANSVSTAISDFMSGAPLKVDINDAKRIVNDYFQAQQQAEHKEAIDAGKQFLADNAKRPGVVKLASGLQYEVITNGPDGPKPSANSKVTVHYTGTLLDGTVFDSSVQRGEPATFGVNQVIKGWTEALQLMKAGDKWKLYIPYDLAYGERGAGRDITPYATLIFEVELIKIQ